MYGLKPFEDTIYIDSVPVFEYKSGTNRAEENICLVYLCSDDRMVFSDLVIIFLFLK